METKEFVLGVLPRIVFDVMNEQLVLLVVLADASGRIGFRSAQTPSDEQNVVDGDFVVGQLTGTMARHRLGWNGWFVATTKSIGLHADS